MKIVLISLPHPYLRQPDAQAPIGILYLASILEQHNIDVEIKNYSSQYTHEAIADLPEADLYGITITSIELPQANRFAYLIREKFPKSIICLGGPGTYTSEFTDWNVINTICQGDGEHTILDIIHDVEKRCIKKIYHGKTVQNLDTIPFPARHLMRDNLGGNIFAYNKNYVGNNSTVLVTSRGCPFNFHTLFRYLTDYLSYLIRYIFCNTIMMTCDTYRCGSIH